MLLSRHRRPLLLRGALYPNLLLFPAFCFSAISLDFGFFERFCGSDGSGGVVPQIPYLTGNTIGLLRVWEDLPSPQLGDALTKPNGMLSVLVRDGALLLLMISRSLFTFNRRATKSYRGGRFCHFTGGGGLPRARLEQPRARFGCTTLSFNGILKLPARTAVMSHTPSQVFLVSACRQGRRTRSASFLLKPVLNASGSSTTES